MATKYYQLNYKNNNKVERYGPSILASVTNNYYDSLILTQ